MSPAYVIKVEIKVYTSGLAQNCGNSIASTIELLQFCKWHIYDIYNINVLWPNDIWLVWYSGSFTYKDLQK